MPPTSGNLANTVQGHLEPLGYEQISSLNTAKTLTPPAKARLAMIQPQTKDISWRDDGTAPTASVGMFLAANDTLVYTGKFSAIKLIETSASAKVNVTYYG